MNSTNNRLELALQQYQMGRLEPAAQLCREIVQTAPDCAAAWHLLGVVVHQTGDSRTAAEYIERAISIDASNVEFYKNLGAVYGRQGEFERAIACFRQALQLQPDYIDALYNLAVTFEKLGRYDEAIAGYRKLLQMQPNHLQAHNNLGIVYLNQGDSERAEENFKKTIRLNPQFAPAHYYLAALFKSRDNIEQAAGYFEQAIRLAPDNILWQLEKDLLCPRFLPNSTAIDLWRTRIDAALDTYPPGSINLEQWQMKVSGSSNVYPPVHLAYHGRNERPLREKLGRLFSAPQGTPSEKGAPKPRNDGPYRIGFLVTKNHEQGIIYFVAGLINKLDKARFQVAIICPAPSVARLKPAITRNDVQFLTIPENLAGAAQKIKAAALDLIYFWEVGTDTLNYLLPFYRLAPVQCVSWGTPTTSGVAEIDYYISSELFENPGAEAHYTEHLVQLKGLPTYYYQPPIPGPKKLRAQFGLPEKKHIYLCCQNLAKLHPSFDAMPAQILRHDRLAVVALVGSNKPEIAEKLMARLKSSAPDVAGRIQLLAGQNYADYLGLLGVVDVILDTPHFNGGATSLEALCVGTPVVTLPGQFMRGRMTFGCYQKMGVMDCVASSVEDYVNIALKLGTDKAYREVVKAKIAARNHVLIEDESAVQEMEQFFEQAIRGQITPPDRSAAAEAHRRQGLILKKEGRLAAAVGSFRQAVALAPAYVEAGNNLGTTLAQLGELAEAEEVLRQAVQQNNKYAQAHYNLGLVLQRREKPDEAADAFRRALQLNPDDGKYLANLGLLLHARGQFAEAATCFRKLLSVQPDYVDAYHYLGLSLAELGELDEAAAALQAHLWRQPEHPESLYNLGVILLQQGNLDAAEAQFQQALALRPDYAPCYYGLGNIHFRRREYEPAEQYYRRYLHLRPDDVEAGYVLAVTLRALEKFDAAMDYYRRVLALQPNNRLRQLEAATLCPSIMDNAEMIRQWRSHIQSALENYLPGSINLQAQLPEISGNVFPPMELAYHGLNDRLLKERFAAIFAAPPASFRPRISQRNAPHRIGFLVTRNHERGFLQFVAGLLPHFNRANFKITVICPASGLEKIGPAFEPGQVDILPTDGNLAADIQKIRQQQLDLIYYWEIGTDTQNYLLPFFRLAPVQCATWAVPTTTGIPQVDYFISSRLFETEGAAAHYSEQLVQLQTLGVYFKKPQLTGKNSKAQISNSISQTPGSQLPTPNSQPLTPETTYICPQNLKKFHPDFDLILGQILRRNPRAKLLLKNKTQQLTDDLMQRFRRTIPDVVERIQFVAEQSYQDYLQWLASADVALDTVGYTGGTTTFECLAFGLPVVTLPGQFMRGRMTLGCYRRIGVLDCVANSPQEYVGLAVKLGVDHRYRQQIRQKILAANYALYEDAVAARELEQFFRQAIATNWETKGVRQPQTGRQRE